MPANQPVANIPARPYDQYLLQKHIALGELYGPSMANPGDVDQTIIHDPAFQYYPHHMFGAVAAVRGLGNVIKSFTSTGRDELIQARRDRLQHRDDVAAYIGDRILNPRTTTDPREKIGWVGINKRYHGESPRPEDMVNAGLQLFGKTTFTPETPNSLRPTTRGERGLSRRMEDAREKSVVARRQARWLSDSYGPSLSAGAHSLSPSEQSNMRRTSRKIARLERKAERKERKFDRIAAGQDFRRKYLA